MSDRCLITRLPGGSHHTVSSIRRLYVEAISLALSGIWGSLADAMAVFIEHQI